MKLYNKAYDYVIYVWNYIMRMDLEYFLHKAKHIINAHIP